MTSLWAPSPWPRVLVAIAVVWLDKRLLAAAELCRCATRGRNAAARVGLALVWLADQSARLPGGC
jgi:hypothetical protein